MSKVHSWTHRRSYSAEKDIVVNIKDLDRLLGHLHSTNLRSVYEATFASIVVMALSIIFTELPIIFSKNVAHETGHNIYTEMVRANMGKISYQVLL